MKKKKKLEDVIPEGVLGIILAQYSQLRDIDNTYAKDLLNGIRLLNKIGSSLQKLVDIGWLPEKAVKEINSTISMHADSIHNCLLAYRFLNTKAHFNNETEDTTIIDSRKTKGQPFLYAKAYLVGTLALTVKSYTGRANYGLINRLRIVCT